MNLYTNLRIALKVTIIVSLTFSETIGYSSFKPEAKSTNDDVIKEANKKFKCGVSSGNKVQLTHNGDGEITSYPWFVLLEFEHVSLFRPINCAGVIVDDLHVLTSSYCAKQNPVSVRYGELKPNCTNDDTVLFSCLNPSQHALVGNTRIHPSAFQLNLMNRHDSLALMRLSTRLEFNEFVRPICLSTGENAFENVQNFFYPQWNLKLSQVPSESFIKRSQVQDINTCNEAHNSRFTAYKDKLICVSPGSVLSGGPLVHVEFKENDTRKIYVVGVKNLVTLPCNNQTELSDTYTKVSSYSNWLLDIINNY